MTMDQMEARDTRQTHPTKTHTSHFCAALPDNYFEKCIDFV